MLQKLLITGPDGTIESDAEFPVLEQALKTGTHTRLILIMPECCKKPGYLTQARYEDNASYNCCPHCGRWTEIRLAKEVQYA